MNNACASWCDDDELMKQNQIMGPTSELNEKILNDDGDYDKKNLDKFWWRALCTFGFYWVEYLKMVFAIMFANGFGGSIQ